MPGVRETVLHFCRILRVTGEKAGSRAQHILIKPVNQLTDAAESFVQRRRETAPDERIAPEASGGDNRFYGTERMLAALNACDEAMPQELLAAVQTDVDCAWYVLPQEEKRKVKL